MLDRPRTNRCLCPNDQVKDIFMTFRTIQQIQRHSSVMSESQLSSCSPEVSHHPVALSFAMPCLFNLSLIDVAAPAVLLSDPTDPPLSRSLEQLMSKPLFATVTMHRPVKSSAETNISKRFIYETCRSDRRYQILLREYQILSFPEPKTDIGHGKSSGECCMTQDTLVILNLPLEEDLCADYPS